ncbi:hypothetical protein WJX73_000698 [Symbiochloris irregularis]|uniref:Glycine-rich protein n=1 Tax=Symbiochloris irregularis TaxID=706552 RepID=A0AAW1PVM8_9CHLO
MAYIRDGKVVDSKPGWSDGNFLAFLLAFFYQCLDFLKSFFNSLLYGDEAGSRPGGSRGDGGGRGPSGGAGGPGRGSRIAGMDSIRNSGSGCGPSGA